MDKTTKLRDPNVTRTAARMRLAGGRPSSAIAIAAFAVALLAVGCGGVQFQRADGSGKYRAMPLDTEIKVVQADAELAQPTELIGSLSLTTKGDPPAHEKALTAMKKHAARYGCDALVGFTNAKREKQVKRKVKSLGKGGVPVYEEVTDMYVEYDWTG